METEYKPLVSVIIPTYKRSNMLPRAIASVLTQTYKNVEVIVVDDNNPDTEWREKTSLLMEQYAQNESVQYVCHTKNMNGSVARNTGIKQSRGDIVAFLDDDDEYKTNKIEKQVAYLLENKNYRAVYCGWDRDGETVIPHETGNLSYNLLSGDHIIYTNAIMMWKEDAIACGGWDETFKRHQEAAFLLRYFRNGGLIGVIEESLVEFDISDRSNEATDSIANEKQTQHYLNSYSDVIEYCEKQHKGDKKNIYSHRGRSILLCHLKTKNWSAAKKTWYFYFRQMPVKFNLDFIRYTFVWLKKHKFTK